MQVGHQRRAAAMILASGLLAGTPLSALGQVQPPAVTSDRALPKNLTPEERAYLVFHPLGTPADAVTPPPTGPVSCPGEYEPADGVIIAWRSFYPSGWYTILSGIAKNVTTVGEATVYCVIDNAGLIASATAQMAAAGADMSRVKFIEKKLDTIWCRDYGPRYIYEGDCRAVVDHTYNRPRPNDDTTPVAFAAYKNHARYELDLIHGGGNYHLSTLGDSHTTRLINTENPTKTEQEIHDIWLAYQNVDTGFYTPFPTTVDATQHIDMWMQVTGDRSVVISDWPFNAGSTQDVICDAAAASMAAAGYSVTRVPARSVSGTHYTYTNVVMCNDLVLIPGYLNGTVAPHNAEAVAAWQAAMPGKAIVQMTADSIVIYAGVFHCIVMHVPAHKGGVNPTAYLKSPNGGEAFDPGDEAEIRWISDDDAGTTSVDLLLSTDGGATYPVTIASGVADDGSYLWTVPALPTAGARVRVVARDAAGNTGHDSSDASFAIGGCYADCDQSTGPGVLDFFDFVCFQDFFAAGDPYACDCDQSTGPGVCDFFDFVCFQDAFAGGCP